MEQCRKKFSLIGPGKVGVAFSYLIMGKGYQLRRVIGRSSSSLHNASSFLGKDIIYLKNLTTSIQDSDFILLGVPDDQIENLVKSLWLQKILRVGQTVIHFSGVHQASIGHSSRMEGIGRLSLHPLQAVTDVEKGIAGLSDSVWGIEGNEQGLQLAVELLNSLSAKWVRVKTNSKPLYHAAACIVSNYLVTLMQIGIDMLSNLGFSPELAQKALYPLLEGTVSNLKEKNPPDALTGPLARGDKDTIVKHLEVLSQSNPQWQEVYRILGKATLQFALLSKENHEVLCNILEGGRFGDE